MKLLFVSLGCDKNLVDSERMITLLRRQGFTLTSDEAEAEVIVVNTCCFIDAAKSESIEEILRLAEYRKTGALRCLAAAGCLAERYAGEIRKELPEVDVIVGTTEAGAIAAAVKKALSGEGIPEPEGEGETGFWETERTVSTPGHYEYLKIAEGCSRHCTYCIIPKVRGPYRSVPEEVLLREARRLSEAGVKELILVAQETDLYGTDFSGRKLLPELLRKLAGIGDFRWIRLMYCYPEEITGELLEVMKEEPKVLPYFDLPIQHASDRILRAMGRRTTADELRETIRTLRRELPEVVLRTTLISGFPGESEEDHQELMAFVEEIRFDRLGVFPYSAEEGTPAALFSGQIPEEERERRAGELMALQQRIAFEDGTKLIGQKLPVIVEGRLPEEGVLVGRTWRDAPDVDGLIFLKERAGMSPVMTGDFVSARVTGTKDYDLTGEILRPSGTASE